MLPPTSRWCLNPTLTHLRSELTTVYFTQIFYREAYEKFERSEANEGNE